MKASGPLVIGSAVLLCVACAGGIPNAPPGGSDKGAVVSPKSSIDSKMEGGLSAVAVSGDGKIVIVQGTGVEETKKNVQIWDLTTQKKLHEFNNPIASVRPVAASPDGKTVAYATDRGVSLRDVATGKEVRDLGPGYATGIAFSPKGDLIVVAARSSLSGRDPMTGEERFSWPGDDKKVTALSGFFDEGRKIASAEESGTIKVWDVATGKPIQTLTAGHRAEVLSLAASADGKRLASVEFFEAIEVWDLATGKVLRTIEGSKSSVRIDSMVFLHDNRTLVYEADDTSLALVDVENGKLRHRLKGHTKHVWSMSLSADGSTLVSGGVEGAIKVWDVKSLQ